MSKPAHHRTPQRPKHLAKCRKHPWAVEPCFHCSQAEPQVRATMKRRKGHNGGRG